MYYFFFNDTATTEIYTLSLHDALPIFENGAVREAFQRHGVVKLKADWTNGDPAITKLLQQFGRPGVDRKSTRLNSSHGYISYAVFCLKKKNNKSIHHVLYLSKSSLYTH